MKSFVSAIMIFSFVGAALFGVFGMNHVADGTHIGCIAATEKGSCPEGLGAFGMAIFHSDIVKGFLMAVLNYGASFSVLLVALLFITAAFVLFRDQGSMAPVLVWSRAYIEYASLRRQQIAFWLSLHENSPSAK